MQSLESLYEEATAAGLKTWLSSEFVLVRLPLCASIRVYRIDRDIRLTPYFGRAPRGIAYALLAFVGLLLIANVVASLLISGIPPYAGVLVGVLMLPPIIMISYSHRKSNEAIATLQGLWEVTIGEKSEFD